ncbi:carbohydrate binding domain-containing protein [Guptibacillus algicola]|uniref:carbohydrate binding domain-containing protein n=1 Tax=Guptibacillus algicola TaxID=225844 RepID=UPI001CD208DD|nr:carbohydrate binding domain-containing protein [Alkalihalobacillus algicola]MCA0989302.1 carbohydrate binding domain-containing protein [Alkalihalobacillus algicola]
MRNALSVMLAGVLVLSPMVPTAASSTDKGKGEKSEVAVNAQFNPVATKGKLHGTTRVKASVQDGHHLAVKISHKPITVEKGQAVPNDRTVTNPYQSGADISGVDAAINKYVMVYVVNVNQEVVDFKQLTLKKNDVRDEDWNIVWEDDFDGTAIDEDKWNFIEGGGGYGNNEWQNYTSREKNARVEDGSLVIEAHKEQYGGNDYTSAKLTTENKGDWTYGRYEIRAKLPKGQGMWPAIWMMPTDYDLYSGWPATGEIDIMELLGHEPDTVHGTLHYGKPWKNTGEKYKLPVGDFSDDYHTFTVDWEPGEFRWYVDGILYSKQNDWFTKSEDEAAPYTYPAPFDRDFFLQLNLAVGGNWPGYPDETTTFPNKMLVDYVKVYELDGEYREAGERPGSGETVENLREPIDGDYVYNGSFDSDLEYWAFQPFEPGSGFAGEGSAIVDNGEVKVEISKPGSETYGIQLVQSHLPIENGERYKLTFNARSTDNRNMVVNVSSPERSFTRYLADKTIALTSESKEYAFEFDMEDTTDANARIEFNMGQSSDLPVWIDNVSLTKLPKDPNASKKILPDGNYIYNGTFDQGDDRKVFWNLNLDKKVKARTSVDPAVYQREMKVNVKKSSSLDDVRLTQDKLNLEQGTCVLTFDAKADEVRSIGVRVRNEDLNAELARKDDIKLTDEMKSYQLTLQLNDSDPKSVFEFLLGGQRSAVAIDNVQMKRVSPPVTIDGATKLEAEAFQTMSGVQVGEDGGSVGWIDEGDWMQYAVDVKEAGDYTVRYHVATDRDNGSVTLLSKAGNVYNGTRGMSEITPEDADGKTSINVARTGGWGAFKTVTDTIYLNEGIQTLQLNAPNVNVDWFSFVPENSTEGIVSNGDFAQNLAHWGTWWGDQWSGVAEGDASVVNGQLEVAISKTGAQSYSPQVFQENLVLENGKTYQVSFDAKSSIARDIKLVIGEPLSNDPWFNTFTEPKVISITEEMKTQTMEFVMNQDTNVNGKLVFELGKVNGESVPATITLDNVKIEEVK